MKTMSVEETVYGQPNRGAKSEAGDPEWNDLYKIGGAAALVILGLTVIQIVIFAAWPPPQTVSEWFTLFQENPLLGLLSLDLLYLVTNLLLVPLYLAFYFALYQVNRVWMFIAVVFGLIGMAAYTASNTTFEIFSLSRDFANATTIAEQSRVLAAGQAILAIYKGTAFDVYYILNAITLLIIAIVILRSKVFSKATGAWGLLSGLFMLVPSTVPGIGTYFALASLVPWTVFSILAARRFFQMGNVVK